MTDVIELVTHLAELGVLGYIVRRLRKQPTPELKDLVKQAIAKRLESGELLSGRERLRARLLDKEAKRP